MTPTRRRPIRILIAPDSFKGSLSSVEVARALADGWLRARPDDDVHLSPLADGGEGTLDAIELAGGWVRKRAQVFDPIGRTIVATWLTREAPPSREAVVELASASGLSRLNAAERDPFGATTFGTGQLLAAAIEAGARSITLGIGGSATTDGGRGLLDALGAQIELPSGDGRGDMRPLVDLTTIDPRLGEVDLQVACDVDNPLLGERGAAATYGPQKGASPADVAELDARLTAWADALESASGRVERETPGAGAAGGVGFALLCLQDRLRSFSLRPGVELVMEATGFDAALRHADLVLTGEGRVDAQTAFGKTALGVARRARDARISCIAVGGGVSPEGIEVLSRLDVTVVPVSEAPQSVEAAMAAGAAPVERASERIARLIEVGAVLNGRVPTHARA